MGELSAFATLLLGNAEVHKVGSVVKLNKPGHTYHNKLADVLGIHPTYPTHTSVHFIDPFDQKENGFIRASFPHRQLIPVKDRA
jgi:hypothetical protein